MPIKNLKYKSLDKLVKENLSREEDIDTSICPLAQVFPSPIPNNPTERLWDDKDFVKEIDERTAAYEKGTAKLYKFENMKKAAIAVYKAKKSTKK